MDAPPLSWSPSHVVGSEPPRSLRSLEEKGDGISVCLLPQGNPRYYANKCINTTGLWIHHSSTPAVMPRIQIWHGHHLIANFPVRESQSGDRAIKIAYKTTKWRISGFTAEQKQTAERGTGQIYTRAGGTQWTVDGQERPLRGPSGEAITATITAKPSGRRRRRFLFLLLPFNNF